jgi:hypothetical protein
MKKALKRMVKSTICLALVLMFTFSFPVFATNYNDGIIDNFENYLDNTALNAQYSTTNGKGLSLSLETTSVKGGIKALKVSYVATGWQEFDKPIAQGVLTGCEAIDLYVNANGVSQTLYFMVVENGEVFLKSYPISGSGYSLIRVMLNQLAYNTGAWIDGVLNISAISSIRLGVNIWGAGDLFIDDITVVRGNRLIDNFDGYLDNTALNAQHSITNGTGLSLSLETTRVKVGGIKALKVSYAATGYQEFDKPIAQGVLTGCEAIDLYVNANGVSQTLYFMVVENGEVFLKSYPISGYGYSLIRVMLNQLAYHTGLLVDGVLNKSAISSIRLGVNNWGAGELFIDDIAAVKESRLIDNFEGYANLSQMQSNWIKTTSSAGSNTYFANGVSPYGVGDSTSSPNAMQFYILNYEAPNYFATTANGGKPLTDLSNLNGFEIMAKGDSSNNLFMLQVANNVNRWVYSKVIDWTGWQKLTINMSDFVNPDTASYDYTNIDKFNIVLSIIINTNWAAGPTSWTTNLYVDDIKPIFKAPLTLSSFALNTDNTISNIAPNTQISAIYSNLSFNDTSSCIIKDKDGVLVTDYAVTAKTGYKFELIIGKSVVKTYETVVYGDANGDGIIDLNDLVNLKSDLLNITKLQGVFKKAASINNLTTPTISDLLSIKKHILNISSIVVH